VEIKPVAPERSGHRLSLRRRLGTDVEVTARASFDGEALSLPESLAVFPAREANAPPYVWLAAPAAPPGAPRLGDVPLPTPPAARIAAREMTAATLADAPGFARLHADLAGAHLDSRRLPWLPEAERTVEAVIRHLLGDPRPLAPKAARLLRAVETGDL